MNKLEEQTAPQRHEYDDHDDVPGHVDEHKVRVAEYVRLILMAIVILASLLGWWKHFMNRDWLAFAATLIGGFPIFEEAWENLRKRRMTMELSMTIALVAAMCIGQFFTALVITLFVLVAEILEGMTVERGRHAIEELLHYLPPTALVRRDGLLELRHGLCDGHRRRSVQHDAHRPLVCVHADEDHGAAEVRVLQCRRCEQELTGERFPHQLGG